MSQHIAKRQFNAVSLQMAIGLNGYFAQRISDIRLVHYRGQQRRRQVSTRSCTQSPSKSQPDKMIVTAAYYEAGHALLAVAVGNPIVRMTIRRRGIVLGRVHHRGVDLTQIG